MESWLVLFLTTRPIIEHNFWKFRGSFGCCSPNEELAATRWRLEYVRQKNDRIGCKCEWRKWPLMTFKCRIQSGGSSNYDYRKVGNQIIIKHENVWKEASGSVWWVTEIPDGPRLETVYKNRSGNIFLCRIRECLCIWRSQYITYMVIWVVGLVGRLRKTPYHPPTPLWLWHAVSDTIFTKKKKTDTISFLSANPLMCCRGFPCVFPYSEKCVLLIARR